MQLAASVQRAHPPPVPPRPSRQVAEALKKSPRPPCPTRQAPAPPPNQRPWRLEEQQHQQQQQSKTQDGGGRPIVYDSAHLQQAKGNGNLQPTERRSTPMAASPSKVVGLANGIKARIEDTTKRKDESSPSRISNKNNSEDDNDDFNDDFNGDFNGDFNDEEKGKNRESKTEESVDRKKNVTFVETQTIVETAHSSSTNNDGGPTKSNKENCATVVVIDEAEGSRLIAKSPEEPDNIQRLDWLEAGVRYSATKITLPAEEAIVNGCSNAAVAAAVVTTTTREEEEEEEKREMLDEEEEEGEGSNAAEFSDLDFSSIIERIAMSSLQGLPPLPRSLSGFNLNGAGLEPAPPPPARSTSKATQRSSVKTPSSTTSLSSQSSRPSPQGRQLTTLDTQLAILRREMFGLRQLDLSLLSQLWSLNESIQEFRQLLQDQEDRVPSPSPSSEEGDDTSYGGGQPPPPPRRPSAHHRHHHRAARSSKLPPSDESPSSEEYGAV